MLTRTSPTAGVLRITVEAYESLREQAREADAAECCGALIGDPIVDRAVALANEARDRRNSYRISPLALFHLERTADIRGFYHSHPDGSATPSARDLDSAWPGYVYVIIGERVRAWQLDPEGATFAELALSVE